MEKKIKDGSFREDLFYRLNVIPITMPSLRERRDDIPLIVAHFLRNKIGPRMGQTFQIERAAMEALCAYHWPGNVRELENVVERGCALCDRNTIQLSDLPAELQSYGPPATSAPADGFAQTGLVEIPAAEAVNPVYSLPDGEGQNLSATSPQMSVEPLKEFLREQEVGYLNRTLAQTGGDKERTAELLGISLATLYRKLTGQPPD